MSELEQPSKEVYRLSDNFGLLFSPIGERTASQYKPKDSDVIVVGTPKTGTTWVQQVVTPRTPPLNLLSQIMHGLRSGGDMEFDEMSKAIPILEYFHRGQYPDFYSPQKYQPNMFKCHMLYNKVPKGNAKHIIVVRNPADAAVSMFYYIENWLYKKGDVTLKEFVEWFYIKPSPLYEISRSAIEMNFIAQAYPHRKDKGVLWLHYDDLKADLKSCVKLVSDFMNIGVGDQELLDLVEYQATFEFMKKHKDKFDSGFVKRMTSTMLGIEPIQGLEESGSKVRKGVSGEGTKEISQEQLKALDNRWKELVQPVCGYATYEEMRAGINKELVRSFGRD